MRFELIDQVTDQGADYLVGVKNVTSAEEYLADHFPTFAVLPGVMMLETMVQAARKLLASIRPGTGPWVVAEVRNVRYGNMVRPGEQLQVKVELFKASDDRITFKGEGTVHGSSAVQGRFVLRPIRGE